MNDDRISEALTDIAVMRAKNAAGGLFRSFGPAVVAGTGLLAGLAALAQSDAAALFADGLRGFVFLWVGVALVAGATVGVEAVARSHRIHGGVSDAMFRLAFDRLAPAAGAVALWIGVRSATTGPRSMGAPSALGRLSLAWSLRSAEESADA